MNDSDIFLPGSNIQLAAYNVRTRRYDAFFKSPVEYMDWLLANPNTKDHQIVVAPDFKSSVYPNGLSPVVSRAPTIVDIFSTTLVPSHSSYQNVVLATASLRARIFAEPSYFSVDPVGFSLDADIAGHSLLVDVTFLSNVRIPAPSGSYPSQYIVSDFVIVGENTAAPVSLGRGQTINSPAQGDVVSFSNSALIHIKKTGDEDDSEIEGAVSVNSSAPNIYYGIKDVEIISQTAVLRIIEL